MKLNTLKATLLSISVCAAMAACSNNDDDEGEMEIDMQEVVAFDFSTAAPDSYTRIDRSGMPAISTALIASKDAYNDANPVVDSGGQFVGEIIASLTFLHGALDGQLQDLGLTPCTVVGDGSGTCVSAAQPLIIPDTLKVNTNEPAGFPNGRLLTDPVIDVTLAVALLELTADPAVHAATDLVGILNPAANDLEFSDSFPFLAPAH